MANYYKQCPKCGGHIHHVCTWDTVTAQVCDADEGGCGWSKEFGYVSGPPGEHYLIENDYEEEQEEDYAFEEQFYKVQLYSCVPERLDKIIEEIEDIFPF